MCDCYDARCAVCKTTIPLHLQDYATDRDDIAVFCHAHIPGEDVVVFTLTEDTPSFQKGTRIAVRPLTDLAYYMRHGNTPNLPVRTRVDDRVTAVPEKKAVRRGLVRYIPGLDGP